MKRLTTIAVLLLLAWCASGCSWVTGVVGTQIHVRSTTRSLREQVLGVYDDVAEEVFMLAGVRAVDPMSGRPAPPPPMSESERLALEARRRIEFNRDDMLLLKRQGYIGESNRAEPVLIEEACARLRERDPWLLALVEAITAEERTDREAIRRRIMQITPVLQADDGDGMLRAILADRYRIEADPGMRIQLPDGNWTVKGAQDGG